MHAFPDVSDLPTRSKLPNPLRRVDGSIASRPDDWPEQREYLKRLFAHYLYGPMPPKPVSFKWETCAEGEAVHGAAKTLRAEVTLERAGEATGFNVAVLRPDRPGRFPVIIKNGNFLLGRDDPAATDAETGSPKNEERLDQQEFANEQAIQRGYVLCKFLREDVARDAGGRRDRGVFPLYPEYREWGVIAAWAWAYQILIDALVETSYVDADKIVATGHSRGGKAALCAGIYDERIAVTAPNSSGTGGTGSWRFFDDDHDEQRLAYHEQHHAHWWSPRLLEFVGRERRLPFDAHTARAAIAPRAVLNTHAREDWWANPYGTALCAVAAQPVYDWLNVPDHNTQHWRDGGHDQDREDWAALFDFCERYFFDRPCDREFPVNPHPDRYSYDANEFQFVP